MFYFRYVDGNFKQAPPELSQLYVIRCPAGESTITCVYALLEDKSRETYTELFQAVIDRCAAIGLARPDPRYMHADFEIAAHQAARLAFNNVGVNGCFYHLTQVSNPLISWHSTDIMELDIAH